MRRTFPSLTIIFSALAMLGALAGVYAALHSSLFMVRVVEVSDQEQDAPLEPREVTALAAVPLGEVSLFDLNLKSIEKRLLAHHWVREVVLIKRFPQTLSIQVIYRQPLAILQGRQGALRYVDSDGSLFGPVTLRGKADLPMIDGVPTDAEGPVRGALAVLEAWGKYSWKTANQVSQVSWDEDSGYTLWIAFEPAHRVSVLVGPDDFLTADPAIFGRIDAVLKHLASKAIAIRQIFADANKKIVVRTARGS
jgi:cell division septal protein FtsQ